MVHPDFGSNPRPQDFKITLYQQPQATWSNVLFCRTPFPLLFIFLSSYALRLGGSYAVLITLLCRQGGGYTNVSLGVQVQVRLGAILSSTSGWEEILGAREPRVWERDARHWTFPVSRLDFKPWFCKYSSTFLRNDKQPWVHRLVTTKLILVPVDIWL